MKLFEIIDMKSAAKQIDANAARAAVVKSGGNFLDNKMHKAAKKVKKLFTKK